MEVSEISGLNNFFLIKAINDSSSEDVILAYKELIKLFQGKKCVSILQDFRKLNTMLSLDEFDKLIKLCKISGLIALNVATVTYDMGRAFAGVHVQEIGEKYGIKVKIYYSKDIAKADEWLRTNI